MNFRFNSDRKRTTVRVLLTAVSALAIPGFIFGIQYLPTWAALLIGFAPLSCFLGWAVWTASGWDKSK